MKDKPEDIHDELRSSSSNISCFGRGFHKSDRHRKHLLKRSKQDTNLVRREGYGIAGLGISDWDMNSEVKALALALLGNRSLARRRVGDIQGSLFDAVTSLQLDPSWIRGYLRKAAALREDGRLQQARKVVMEGLKQDSNHAGLIDILRSIEEAVEKERMVAEESRADIKLCESEVQSAPSAVAGSC
ncbi:hypothetical protein FGB62_6g145 [Gracilaria domingensis]|nr:hypothetical protein FGB62_20g210 [Gracilaria domingensis]KAI0566768.1 hypothetical protein FGB62_6g145 [Gracilaria domingensis]